MAIFQIHFMNISKSCNCTLKNVLKNILLEKNCSCVLPGGGAYFRARKMFSSYKSLKENDELRYLNIAKLRFFWESLKYLMLHMQKHSHIVIFLGRSLFQVQNVLYKRLKQKQQKKLNTKKILQR